jgi:hypothetical protein
MSKKRKQAEICRFFVADVYRKSGELVISIDVSSKDAYTGMELSLLSLVEGIGHCGTGQFST